MPDALKRNPFNDYTEGWFHVTLNVRGEAPVLGYVTGDASAPLNGKDAPRVVLTELGKGVLEAWKRMSVVCATVDIDECVAMPEHFHGLLHLLPGNKRHLGSLISGFMSGCSHAYWDVLGIDWRENRYDKGAYALKKDRDRDHTRSYRGPSLFVRGYNDVEAVTVEEIEIKRQYIRDNPRKRLITRSNPDCFRIVRDCFSRNWTLERALSAVTTDIRIGDDQEKRLVLQKNVSKRLKRQSNNTDLLAIDYIGSYNLLSSKHKVSLICHRKDVALFDQQASAVMQAARDGAVIVSAFISPKERDIMKLLMQEQLPFIELMDNGFSDRYKPIGRSFYSTAENRHLQLTCWTYEYKVSGDTVSPGITREMCLVMNELVRVISGVDDYWWKQ